MIKRYVGKRDHKGNAVVHVIDCDGDSRLLDPRRDLFDHSQTGFEWGYEGSGPAQLALALLADAFHVGGPVSPQDGDELAVTIHQEFERAIVSKFPIGGWHIEAVEVCRQAIGIATVREDKR